MKDKVQELLNAGDIKGAAEFIKQSLKEVPEFDNLNISYAHILLLSGAWKEIDALLVKDTNSLTTSGWLNSIYAGRPVNKSNEPIPWYTYPAIDFLDEVVKDTWTVFESGSGNSTLWWSSRVKSIVSVEDDHAWYQEISLKMPPNATINFKQGKDYSDYLLSFPDQSFDAVVVDGSYRNETASNCIDKIKEDGLIVFDNSDNPEFNRSQTDLLSRGFYRIDFWGLIPSYLYKNCTSVYFRDPNIFRFNKLPSVHQSSVGMSCQQALRCFS